MFESEFSGLDDFQNLLIELLTLTESEFLEFAKHYVDFVKYEATLVVQVSLENSVNLKILLILIQTAFSNPAIKRP